MHLRPLLAAAALAAAPCAAAQCFIVYDGANRMVYRETRAPVDLSGSIAEAMRARFPGGRLVITEDVRSCRSLDGAKVDVTVGAMSTGMSGTFRPSK
jgi:hypothetical protein